MADEASPAVAQSLLLHRSKERFGFRLDCFGEKPPGTVPQHCGQRILDRVGMSKCGNRGICRHGVSLLLEVRAGFNNRPDTPPFSDRHHPDCAIAPRKSIKGFEAMLWLRTGFDFTGGWTVRRQNELITHLFGLQKVNKA